VPTTPSPSSRHLEPRTRRLRRYLDVIVYLLALAIVMTESTRAHDASWYLGLCFVAAGTPLWIVARWQLGRSFSVRARARELVSSGLYARIRHPIYLFGGLAWTGALLILLGWRGLIVGGIVALVEIWRARREERVLAQAFGAQYEEYRRKTWF